MIKTILFPCEMFSINEVDSCFQKEFDAVIENGDFEVVFYDYEEFAKEGTLHLSKRVEEPVVAMLRGWMLNENQYTDFYERLQTRNINLITTPEQYCQMHLFPRAYSLVSDDTPGIMVYPENERTIDLQEIKSRFNRFMIKDYVKSEKGTDIPKYFDSTTSEEDFFYWLDVFKQYRGKLFTGGICIKQYVDLKKYGENTNEWRIFYLDGNILSVSRNSGQKDFAAEVPKSLVEKYKNLPSPFYTVDYGELADGSWKILEVGDGQVSGLSDNQDARAFFRCIKLCAE